MCRTESDSGDHQDTGSLRIINDPMEHMLATNGIIAGCNINGSRFVQEEEKDLMLRLRRRRIILSAFCGCQAICHAQCN